MFKKICKAIVAIPLYVLLLLEGCFGGCATGNYCDPWHKLKKWILEEQILIFDLWNIHEHMQSLENEAIQINKHRLGSWNVFMFRSCQSRKKYYTLKKR